MRIFLGLISYLIAFGAIKVSFEILLSDRREKFYHAFFILGILCGLNSFFYGLMFAVDSPRLVSFLYRLSSLSWTFYPAAVHMFYTRLFSRFRKKDVSPLHRILYIPSSLFFLLALSGNLLARNFELQSMGWKELDLFSSPWDYTYVGYITIYALYEVTTLLFLYNSLSDRRQRLLTLQMTLPLIVIFLASLLFNILFKEVGGRMLPSLAHLWMGLFTIGTGYFMKRTRFLKFSPELMANDLFDMMTDIALITDRELQIKQMSRAGLDFWGIRKSAVKRGRKGLNLTHLLREMNDLPGPHESCDGLTELTGGNGKKVPYKYVIKSITDYFGTIQGYFFIAWNAEDIIRLKILSETDSLTGLINRLKFNSLLEGEIRACRRYGRTFSLIMFDLDDFKAVNDRFGHPAGDRILKAAARNVDACLRETDSFSRWGGEEFMILCSDSPLEGTRLLAERLRESLKKDRTLLGVEVTASFGVVHYRENETKESLLDRVDNELYKAKMAGKDRVEG